MGYKIIKKDLKERKNNLWDAEIEALIALLAKRLESRNFKKEKIVKELNFKYLRKKENIKDNRNYGATLMQRNILNNIGY